MTALAVSLHLPRVWIAAIGVAIAAGHNLLDPITIFTGTPGHAIWAILHDRGLLDLGGGIRARTSYPVLPWVGTIALGYAAGPWIRRGAYAAWRRKRLILAGAALLAAFTLLRAVNLYGDPVPWIAQRDPATTALGSLNLTKYPLSFEARPAYVLDLPAACSAEGRIGLRAIPTGMAGTNSDGRPAKASSKRPTALHRNGFRLKPSVLASRCAQARSRA